MAHDVFISYSSLDKTTADAICAKLESRRIRCWIAPRDVLAGTDYAEAIINAIEGCQIVVFVLSANSNNSPQVKREIERAVCKGVSILTFKIEDVMLTKSMEFYISTQHWLDALTPPLENHLNKLMGTIELILKLEPAPEDSKERITTSSSQYHPQTIDNTPPVIRKGNRKTWLVLALIGITLIIFLLVNFTWHNNSKINLSEETTPNIEIRFAGRIGESYYIHMRLNFIGKKVSGDYYYDNHRELIELQGTVSAGTIILKEYYNGNYNGIFEGNIDDSYKMEGTWSNATGNRRFRFNLSRDN